MMELWPFTNFHDLNLDWIIRTLEKWDARLRQLFDLTHGHKITMDVQDTTTNSVTGYNGTTYADRDKTVFENDDTETHSGKDTTNETNSGTDKDVRDGYARGNIGVTTTQQMIEAQRDVVKFNLMDYIIDDFKTRFTLLVY